MKINEVEAAVGVTKKNIRFYEEEGLISPSREPGNGYRSYSQADVERLRRIKLLRKLDEQTLARLTAREEQGVTFVNIERTDQKTRRIRGACIGAALFVTMMAFVMAIMGWAIYTDPQDAPPLPLLVVMFGIPAGCIVGTLKVLLDRIEEIGKGEEDAYRNY